MDLFDHTAEKYYKRYAPLAERMRPAMMEHFFGQPDLFQSGSPISMALSGQGIPNLILWGPPGTGKTTLARIIARKINIHFEQISAVHAGKKDLEAVEKAAHDRIRLHQLRTILFIDEIHRFNKAQQDGLLGAIERGVYTLIGATTENPSFELNSAILSRCRVIVLEKLSGEALKQITLRALKDCENGLGKTQISIEESALFEISRLADGDARTALNILELAAIACSERSGKSTPEGGRVLLLEDLSRGLDKRMLLYDKTGDEHYNLISAFIKSIRGSDPQAAVYYLARMISGGEDPVFIARRMCILASEDVGNADPQAAVLANSIRQTVEFVGMPEARIPLSQLAVYLALAPKSNSSYLAIDAALAEVNRSGALKVPLKILNSPTSMMKEMGYGKDYHYAHDYPSGFFPDDFLPDTLKGQKFYHPLPYGFEMRMKEHYERLEGIKKEPLSPDPHA